jgi:uncharacterized protein (UPF0548 family)
MIFQFGFPNPAKLDALKAAQQNEPLTYPKNAQILDAYDYDDNRVLLGEGDATFAAAKEAIRRWSMADGTWIRLYSDKTPIEAGQIVIMCAHLFGLWWLNAARIVYTVDEPRAFGFAYGTLTQHVESGEELFQVEMSENGEVWYRIRAFSRPRYWMVRLTYPLARVFQRRFVRDSFKNMKKITDELRTAAPFALTH